MISTIRDQEAALTGTSAQPDSQEERDVWYESTPPGGASMAAALPPTHTHDVRGTVVTWQRCPALQQVQAKTGNPVSVGM